MPINVSAQTEDVAAWNASPQASVSDKTIKNLIDQFKFRNRKSLDEAKVEALQGRLIQIGEQAVDQLVRGLRTEAAPYIIKILAQIGRPAVPALIEELGQDNLHSFVPTVKALSGIDDPRVAGTLVSSLEQLLTRTDHNTEQIGRINSREVHLIEALVRFHDTNVLQVLRQAKNDTRKIVRIIAAKNLYHLESRESDKRMIVNALADRNPKIRIIATASISKLEDTESIDRLRHIAAEDDDYRVRRKAVAALQQRNDPDSAELMQKIALKDPSPDVQQVAASAYAQQMGTEAIPFLLNLLQLQGTHDKMVDKLKSAVRSAFNNDVLVGRYKVFTLKLAIVKILGAIQDEQANQALMEIETNNRDREVRDFAKIELLGRKGGPDSIHLLKRLIGNRTIGESRSGSLTFFVAPKARLVTIRAREILEELQGERSIN